MSSSSATPVSSNGTNPVGTPILQVENVSISVPTSSGRKLAVEKVNLSVSAGETLGLVGESGSGKSLTALSIMGLLPRPGVRLEAGSILLDGEDLIALPARDLRHRRGPVLSMVFQEPMTSLNPAFTVGEQIAESVRRHEGLGRKAAKQRAVELLERVGIDDARRRYRDYPHAFSGGMRQRVMIAIAIACNPKVLLADEPTTALDVTVQKQILTLIDELRADLGMAVVLVTHDLAVIAEVAHRVAVMYAGQIVETGLTRPMLDQPQHPYLEGLLGAVPQPDRRQERLQEIPGSIPQPGAMPTGCRFYLRCPYGEHGRCDVDPIALRPSATDRQARCVRSAELELRGV